MFQVTADSFRCALCHGCECGGDRITIGMDDGWKMEVENSMPSLAPRVSVNNDVSNIVASISMQSQAPIFL